MIHEGELIDASIAENPDRTIQSCDSERRCAPSACLARLARRVPMSALVPLMRPSCTRKRLPKHSQYSTATAVCAGTLQFFAVSFRPPRSCGPLHHSLPFAVPAHAGIDRSHASRDSARTGFPRTRGDRPTPRSPAKIRPHRRRTKRRLGPFGSLGPLTFVRTVNCGSKLLIRAGPRTSAKKGSG